MTGDGLLPAKKNMLFTSTAVEEATQKQPNQLKYQINHDKRSHSTYWSSTERSDWWRDGDGESKEERWCSLSLSQKKRGGLRWSCRILNCVNSGCGIIYYTLYSHLNVWMFTIRGKRKVSVSRNFNRNCWNIIPIGSFPNVESKSFWSVICRNTRILREQQE